MAQEPAGPMDESARLRDFYAHPVGRDVLDKLLQAYGRSKNWVDNPVVGNMSLASLGRLLQPVTGPDLVPTLLGLVNVERDVPNPGTGEPEPTWWKQAVFYQIYPRSFADSDGNGVGDLGGILQRLDYLADLGVDCVWLSPVFDSPNEDNGYDIRDYRAVSSEMGTLEELDAIIAGCHERGMRIILDLVVNHTSDQHEWFRQAIADPDGPYGQYYHLVPADPEHPDEPPNNWRSAFSEPAWHWVPEAGRWVLHLFSPGQPDLNWENPRVREEVADICRWWFDRGIDGFRMDVINFISKMPGLPDGHPFIADMVEVAGIEHYFYGPRLHEYLSELRAAAFDRPEYPEPKVMVGEAPGIGIETGRLLTGADREELDLVFSFDHLESAGQSRHDDYRYDLEWYKNYLVDYQSRLGANDWMTLYIENHDNPRMISKVNPDPAHRRAIGKLLGTLQLTMRGTPFVYQGQELAAVNQSFAGVEDLRDIESLNRYQSLVDGGTAPEEAFRQVLSGSRDHARVPMRWDATPGAGFTTGTPWIEWREDAAGFSVAEQRDDEGSVLNHYRRLVALRRTSRALRMGAIDFVHPEQAGYFAWLRTAGGERWFVELNLTDEPIEPPGTAIVEQVFGTDRTLAAYESRVFRLDVTRHV